MVTKGQDRIITPECSLLDAFKLMDQLDCKLLMVMEGTMFQGLLSGGDIQRAIIKNIDLNAPVGSVLRHSIRIAKPQDSIDSVKQMMVDFRMELCPVVDDQKKLVEVYFWDDIFPDNKISPKDTFNLPVVIMAGGFGTRLRPITNVIPKPLVPIGDKSMLEHICERFYAYGCNNFHISVNYKARLIEHYMDELQLPYNINYFQENKPKGTAGSLSLLKGKINETFFVSNCDILIKQDYSEILAYHRQHNCDITIVAALKHFKIPYGTIETVENGLMQSLVEKPEFTFKINSGMYVLEPSMIDEIPADEFFHITHLIEKVKNRGGIIGVYPVSEKSWVDIGEWNQYMSLIGK